MILPPSHARALALAVLAIVSLCHAADREKLFVASPLTKEKEFTPGIEGPNCDAEGNIYAVNYGREGTIGRVTPDGKGEIFIRLPGKSVGNGIVFDKKGMMYVADYVGHLATAPASEVVSCVEE